MATPIAQFDLGGSFAEGRNIMHTLNNQKRERELQDFYKDNGQKLAQGDTASIEQLAQWDPNAALNFKKQIQSLEMGEVQLGAAKEARAGARASRARASQAHRVRMGQAKIAAAKAKSTETLAVLVGAKSAEEWDDLATKFGGEQYRGQFDYKGALIRKTLGMKAVMEGKAEPEESKVIGGTLWTRSKIGGNWELEVDTRDDDPTRHSNDKQVGGKIVRANPQTGGYDVVFDGSSVEDSNISDSDVKMGERIVRPNPETGGYDVVYEPPVKEEAPEDFKLNGSIVRPNEDGTYEEVFSLKKPQQQGEAVTIDYDDNGRRRISVGPEGKALTEGQAKAVEFASRMEVSNDRVEAYELGNLDPSGDGPYNPANIRDMVAGKFGSYGNWAKTEEGRLYTVASKNFVAALLRKDTGAAVTPEEWAFYQPMLFAEVGDTALDLAEKRYFRRVALTAIKQGMGGVDGINAQLVLDGSELFDDLLESEIVKIPPQGDPQQIRSRALEIKKENPNATHGQVRKQLIMEGLW